MPRSTGSPPVPVMHSPPRAVSAKEQQDWKIPPCISNWKNAKGYTIPLDKRLAADGRGLQETAINDKYAKFAEALYVAEQQARQVSPHPSPRSPGFPTPAGFVTLLPVGSLQLTGAQGIIIFL